MGVPDIIPVLLNVKPPGNAGLTVAEVTVPPLFEGVNVPAVPTINVVVAAYINAGDIALTVIVTVAVPVPPELFTAVIV